MSTRTVAVFTSGRADLGPLSPVLAGLDAAPDLRLVVLATGTHAHHGAGSQSLSADLALRPESAVVTFDAGLVDDAPGTLAGAIGNIARGVSDAISDHEIDILALLGDRWELLGVAGAALLHQCPVAHIHGGEVTEGALDDRVRHAVTKLADVHFCATTASARRLRQLGEEPWRIHVTGAPGLDAFSNLTPIPLKQLSYELGVAIERPFGLVTYHPPTVDRAAIADRARAVYEAAAATLGTVIVTSPGADPGADDVWAEIHAAVARHDHVHLVPNLGSRYAHAMALADVMVGNSSSGVIEAASFRLPVVNVGDRQRGRLRGRNVLDAADDPGAIQDTIACALSPGFRTALDDLVNPHGDGRAAPRIVSVLATVPLERLARKRFRDAGTADLRA